MERIIELKSNKEEQNFLKRLEKLGGEESYSYLLQTSYTPVAVSTMNNKTTLKPRGSHSIIEGDILEEAGAVVKRITFSTKGWVITFCQSKICREE